jgi:hypothetical protein
LLEIDNAIIASYVRARQTSICASWSEYEMIPAGLLSAMCWESDRQARIAHDAMHGRKAPRGEKLSSLRTAYLRVYAAIAERCHV